ncbi:uncharacterized protein LOC111267674 [Varroa jacobsoni]|uniref:uncharacterized protein LOC111267674 n=1 Tax=Varroa jacobsoni TaxID=62625 RepID=UPI000BF97FC9|nr:uncharacterized protein LOC111267674 [Varroa jacobsoni]
MKNEVENDRGSSSSDTLTPSRSRTDNQDLSNIKVQPGLMLSPFCAKPRGSVCLELIRHIRHDIVHYSYHAGAVTAFYIVMVISFYLGTYTFSPKTEAGIRYIVAKVFDTLQDENYPITTRFANLCVISANDSVLLWRFDMYRFFDEITKNDSVKQRLGEVFTDLEQPFVERVRLGLDYNLFNGSVFLCDSIFEGLNKSRRVPLTNSTVMDTLSLQDLFVKSIYLIKTYALHPPYVEIRQINFETFCIAFVPVVTRHVISFDKTLDDKHTIEWLCPGVNLSGIISTTVIKEIIDNSSVPTVSNCSLEAAVYVQQADTALNGDAKTEPQRLLRRANLVLQVLRYKEDDGGILPRYMYPLVVIAAWTYPMKLIPPRTSCVALHYALIEVMGSNGTYITTLPSKQVVDITLMKLRRTRQLYNCQEVFVNVFVTLINVWMATRNTSAMGLAFVSEVSG